MDRQTIHRALDAAQDARLIWGWRNRGASSVTILTPGGSAALPYALLDKDVPAFLAKRVSSNGGVGPIHWPDKWAHLLNCMERLAEQCNWWEVA